MVKIFMTYYTYDVWAAGFLHFAVQIEAPAKCMSMIIPSNQSLQAEMYGSLPNDKYDL
jgi:hypothetical protein